MFLLSLGLPVNPLANLTSLIVPPACFFCLFCAVAADMQTRTINIVAQQAAMSTQVTSVVAAVSSQLDSARTAAAAAAAEASTAFATAATEANAAAASRAVAANAQIQTALGQITTSVSRTVAGLETNVSTLVASTGGTGDGSTAKNAGRTCTAIKDAFRSSSNGYYYVYNPVNSSELHSTAMLFGEQSVDGHAVLKVFCNFASKGPTAPRRAVGYTFAIGEHKQRMPLTRSWDVNSNTHADVDVARRTASL